MTKEKGRAGSSKALALLCVAFALGAVGGLCLSARLGPGSDTLAAYVRGFSVGVEVSFWEILWNDLRWPLFVWLLGFTALGTWMVPVMLVLRGFFLCFCVAGLAACGGGGLLLAFLLFGSGSLVTLPLLFLLGVQSWTLAFGHRRRLWIKPGEVSAEHWLKSGMALGLSVCWAGGEYWLLPILLKIAAPLLGG